MGFLALLVLAHAVECDRLRERSHRCGNNRCRGDLGLRRGFHGCLGRDDVLRSLALCGCGCVRARGIALTAFAAIASAAAAPTTSASLTGLRIRGVRSIPWHGCFQARLLGLAARLLLARGLGARWLGARFVAAAFAVAPRLAASATLPLRA